MRTLPTLFLALSALMHGYALAAPSDADPDLVMRGARIATAADCVSCHGLDFSGGQAIPSPIGEIFSKNITPDSETGIGTWTLEQFSDALRKGISPDGHLYPAMPYTSYTAMSDEDVKALYSYLMLKVEPVASDVPETHLGFPFFRAAMPIWNALFLNEGQTPGGADVEGDQLIRGRYLVEVLGHCSACHTSRGTMMQELAAAHMAGAVNDGWWAPNISPSHDGIGDWTDQELTDFLLTGHNRHAAAGGQMGNVVANSLSQLSESDIQAIVAYLGAIEPKQSTVKTDDTVVPPPTRTVDVEPQHTQWKASIQHATTDGARLYQSACASCHGADGRGSAGNAFVSLRQADAVTGPYAANLVHSIVNGIDLSANTDLLMPSFRQDMNDEQIAAVANYVRVSFGETQSNLTAADVNRIARGAVIQPPWLIRNAVWLSVLVALVIVALVVWVMIAVSRARSRRKNTV